MRRKIRRELEKVRPQLQADGGDVEFVDYLDGVVTVRLTGACSGCPHASITLKQGIEAHLKGALPEIVEVVAAPED